MLSCCLKIERFVSDSAEMWICGLYRFTSIFSSLFCRSLIHIYYGQYNMNNEKSDSYPIFGQDETIGGEKWGEGDTLNYLEADEEGCLLYTSRCV